MRDLFRTLTFLFLSLSVSWIRAEEPPVEEPPPKPELDLPFPIGEKLTYTIYWGWIAVGESVATTDWRLVDGEWKVVIRFRTKSNGVISSIYPVDDMIETVVNSQTLHPETFEVRIREGDTVRDEMTVFNWETMTAHWTKFHEDKEDETAEIPLEETTRDLVSFMYFMRHTPFEPGGEYDFKVLTDAKIYDLFVKGERKQKVHLETYGDVESLQLLPQAQFQGIFVRKGKVKVWLAEDERQILTKLLLDTPFANVRMLLKRVEGPGEDFWVKNSDSDKQ